MNSLPRPEPASTIHLGRRMYQLWDIALAYMPLFMLSLLLLLSIWLVRNAPTSPPPEAPQPLSHIPDYEFTRFTLRSYDINGKILSAMKGEKAQHFQDTLNTLVQSPDVWIFSDKRLTTATAKQALTNEDGSQVQLMGSAMVRRDDKNSVSKTEQSTATSYTFLQTATRWSPICLSASFAEKTFSLRTVCVRTISAKCCS